MNEKEPSQDPKEKVADLSAMLGMGGLLDGVTNLISKFGELAEKGESLRRASGTTETGKPYQSSMGFSVRFGGHGAAAKDEATEVSPVNVTPVNGGPTKAAESGPKPAQKSLNTREPVVDIFEETDHLLLLVEMPGVSVDSINLQFVDQKLSLEGTSKTTLFRSTVELPRAYSQDQVALTSNNGVVEIRLAN